MKKVRKTTAALNLPTLRLEGGLFLPDQLEKAALGLYPKFQSDADYHTPKGLKLKDDYSRAFQIAIAQWKHFAPQLERTDVDAGTVTQSFVQELLRDAFGYLGITPISGITIGERHFPANLLVGDVPVVVAPHTLDLDDPDTRFAIAGSGSRKKSAFQLAQELLNASPDHLWAIVSNGRQLRLVRDAATLTRPSFLEVDIQDLLGDMRFAEFANAWRLLHASRAGITPNGEIGPNIWEAWREAGQAEGTRVRDGLRHGVTQALLTLGEGFLQHPANNILRQQLHQGQLDKDAYFQQLLRLIYRLIFLFNVEERGVLHPADDSQEAIAARRAYAEGYALARLRELSLKRRARNRFDDHWQALRIVFAGLAKGQPRLALPALGGLFSPTQCPVLDDSSLDNAHLLAAIQQLRWTMHNGSLAPVDYRNMGPEELGSVYESLLELVPEVDLTARQFGFVGLTSEGSTAGNARKLSGSYYTPDSLVQELIKSALEPVIAQRLAERPDNPTEALLSIRVIDPACGSGHFLLAAARRLAETLAQLRAPEGVVKPQDYRHALREVVARCIFGVDRNPMALELARTALWLEGFEEGRPLSFLDHHLQCGDALLGLTDLKALEKGIAKDAYKALSGDDKEVCKALTKSNNAELKQLEKQRNHPQFNLPLEQASTLRELQALENLPEDTTADIAAKEMAYKELLEKTWNSRLRHAADMLLGAYLLPKTAATAIQIPTTGTLYLELVSEHHNSEHQQKLVTARAACSEARVFHWPLAFPQVYAAGGFDCVLGNPPWERIKLQEEEFFATRNRDVAEARNKAERAQRIQWLSEGLLAKRLYPNMEHPLHECTVEQRLYADFITARRTAEAASLFAHVKDADGGRFPLTGVGDVNTYALFSETISKITANNGRAGFIVPTGIATDDSTKAFFSDLVKRKKLVKLLSLYEIRAWFKSTDDRKSFCLLTLGDSESTDFLFDANNTADFGEDEKWFKLSPEDFALLNPNTLTCPVFRSRHDAELTKKIYRAAPILIEDGNPDGNPWGASFMTMMHMSGDSHLFLDTPTKDNLPLYEAKLIHIFDHRWTTYSTSGNVRNISNEEKQNKNFFTTPRYWVKSEEVKQRLIDKGWSKGWLIGWRDIALRSVERTVIATVIPRVGVGHTMPLLMTTKSPLQMAALLGNLASLTLDYVARVKVGGTHLTYSYLKQFPVLPPERYTAEDLAFITSRVLELTFTAHDLTPWAKDLGYDGAPFLFAQQRRAVLCAELDAYYARLYGLTREELRYILDPADVMGEDYPSETFRVLKSNEIKEFREYRTQRLVLEAWGKLEQGELQ